MRNSKYADVDKAFHASILRLIFVTEGNMSTEKTGILELGKTTSSNI